ncbi:hypothetical protein [Sorangium sp. So ce388]|uniref:hypothetical protein n=1 Tax=Sorangium sp. So ce388 TaxID=3133309 RepID=UPI003F5C671E
MTSPADPIAPCRAEASPEQRADLLTPVAGGHVFRGTWEALAELETATCAACGEHIKQDGEPADVVEHDGAGVPHRIMCDGWHASAAVTALPLFARGMVRERVAPDDVGDLLPSRPSHEARADLYSAHWDASQPNADAKASLFRIGKAFEALCAALADEERALRMALEHDEQARVSRPAPPALPAESPTELTAERLDDLDRRAREAGERAAKATPGPWKPDATHEGTPVVYRQLPDVAPNATNSAEVVFEADWGRDEDASFVAAAREDVPALSAAVLALSAEVRRLRGERGPT